MKTALLYEKVESTVSGSPVVRCFLCSHHCIIPESKTGICRVRKNINGELISLNFEKVAATHNDPIEKKPLYHFLPGSTSFSLATMGCNFSCKFCQNHSLSMIDRETQIFGERISPADLVQNALSNGASSISYTYSEPAVFFELMIETATLAKENRLKNIMVTNGYMSEQALETISPYLDAANIDLKAFSDDFYKNYCGAKLAPVLETIKRMKEKGIWVELTTLLIPGLNDDPKEINELISFILSVDKNIPWHVSRFYPQYKLTHISPTNPHSIFSALEAAENMGLRYLYAGNLSEERWSDTLCHSCKSRLIKRSGYHTRIVNLTDGKCGACGTPISGIWA